MNYPEQYKRLSNFINKTDTCWFWTGYIEKEGYGRCTFKHSQCSAHRAIYEIFKGEIPKGLQIDHLCRVRHCVNPEHLEAVTCRVNLLRGYGTAGVNARKEDCPKCGEKLSKKYSYEGRRCTPCRKIYFKNMYSSKKLING